MYETKNMPYREKLKYKVKGERIISISNSIQEILKVFYIIIEDPIVLLKVMAPKSCTTKIKKFQFPMNI